MKLSTRSQLRIRIVLTVVVVCSVLATLTEVREGVCKVATMLIGGKWEHEGVAPVREPANTYARPSPMLTRQHPVVHWFDGPGEPMHGIVHNPSLACEAP
jgi:hypothetical protein